MALVQFDELEGSEQLQLSWGLYWRAVLIFLLSAVVAGLAGGLLGAALGFVMAFMGMGEGAVPAASLLLGVGVGVAVGLGAMWLFLRWIVGTRIGAMRLVLVREGSDEATQFLETHTARL